jgi:hypothetical protein
LCYTNGWFAAQFDGSRKPLKSAAAIAHVDYVRNGSARADARG